MKVPEDIFENTETAFAHFSNIQLQKAKVLFQLMSSNFLVQTGTSVAQLALGIHLPVSPLFRWTVYDQFCGGETFEECKKTIENLKVAGVGVLLNYGVELKESEADFDKSMQANLEAIEFGSENKTVEAVCVKLSGMGRFALFEKIQTGEKLSMSEKKEYLRVKKRLHKLCEKAARHSVPLYIDAEESWIQDSLDVLVEEMSEEFNQERAVVFNTYQMYRWDRISYLQKRIENAQEKKFFLGVKLVRGAYMEKERDRAEAMNYPSPIHKNKEAVDEDFDNAVELCLHHIEGLWLCIASQSEESNLRAIEMIQTRKHKAELGRISFSQLYGMGDNITFNLAKLGLNATKYLPYGPVKEVIPYLIRRAQENTAVAGQTSRQLDLIKREIKRRAKS